MRRGELLELKWSDINFAEGVLYVRRSLVGLKGGTIESEPKTSKGNRSIVLPPFVREILKNQRVQQVQLRLEAVLWQEGDYVFCTSQGTPFEAANLRSMFKDLLKKAALPDIRFHDLRHSQVILRGYNART